MQKRVLAIIGALQIAAALPVHSQTLIGYEYTGSPASFDSVASATVGFRFAVSEAITVTALGVVDTGAKGLAGSHAVGLWTDFGELLATGSVPSGTSSLLVGGFRFSSTPAVSLLPGVVYRVAATFDVSVFEDTWVQAPSLSSPSQVILLDPGATFSASGRSLSFPTDRSLPGSAAANFLFTSAVPELPPLTSLCLGLAILGLALKARTGVVEGNTEPARHS